ncbi:Uncharacterised protein [Pannonibacter phragmitetus]|uniref:Anti-sigma factor NepR domain-containing protein n=2 Tax=Stappiaceae TaxID=2821832 RepID=A0A0U3PC43_9HYPH|nr:hypothetical protein APZ00_04800 [Pannonibacter phragmitetus]SUA99201.1 Uncharacterised protein [Pannonibacter phragmitetus]
MPMNDWKKPGTPDAGTGALDGAHAQQISARLRQLYDTVQNEGIPDRFLDLLERLDEAEERSLKK